VIDETLDLMVTEYARPIADDEALERAFLGNRFEPGEARSRGTLRDRAGWLDPGGRRPASVPAREATPEEFTIERSSCTPGVRPDPE
jgi:hypothetical protein